jgi:hypothetical protein
MPWKKSKTIPGLITHYGYWTKQEINDFYDKVNFSDWRGSVGLVPRGHPLPSEDKEVKDVDG